VAVLDGLAALSLSSVDVRSHVVPHSLRPSECQSSGSFRPCRSSRLRRFTPLRTLQVSFNLATDHGVRCVSYSGHSRTTADPGFPVNAALMRCSHTPRQRFTLRSFSLSTSVPKTSSEPLQTHLNPFDVSKAGPLQTDLLEFPPPAGAAIFPPPPHGCHAVGIPTEKSPLVGKSDSSSCFLCIWALQFTRLGLWLCSHARARVRVSPSTRLCLVRRCFARRFLQRVSPLSGTQ